jgi:hypothetical protein
MPIQAAFLVLEKEERFFCMRCRFKQLFLSLKKKNAFSACDADSSSFSCP